ncbi:hypothetical protein IWX90DRAFT_308334 [Phyllosticta citrichinensis]|uniref:Secreted protein n=1 Tax=Phyllosticta citrichinensis TaxID=1130410 RepID=A0ABR1XLJ5_9PEZI
MKTGSAAMYTIFFWILHAINLGRPQNQLTICSSFAQFPGPASHSLRNVGLSTLVSSRLDDCSRIVLSLFVLLTHATNQLHQMACVDLGGYTCSRGLGFLTSECNSQFQTKLLEHISLFVPHDQSKTSSRPSLVQQMAWDQPIRAQRL